MAQSNSKKNPASDFDKFVESNPTARHIELYTKLQPALDAVQKRNQTKILFFVGVGAFVLFIVIFLVSFVLMVLTDDKTPYLITGIVTGGTSGITGLIWGYKMLMTHYFPVNPAHALPENTQAKLPNENN